ncbi:unnamed protein product [Paramecium sonneborni]|uniref:Uncharacterized protein n=1 Tax=Paramecium sonneborni TaxID=65129 RepID=A0A8S1LCE3_9CILI|nr:unnamed protein product [Paramecium sonneborni]
MELNQALRKELVIHSLIVLEIQIFQQIDRVISPLSNWR